MSSRESEAARIFLEAVEHHERGERADYVREAAAGDPLLVQRVDALLKAHGEPNQMLDGDRLLPTGDIPQPSERPGTMIGPYKLLEQIGEGGMGLVFAAEQQQPVRRKVALKLIKPGMDSRQVIARFEAERQALAMMDHPNIAKILDGGTIPGVRSQESGVSKQGAVEAPLTPDSCPLTPGEGRPYFVMDLVKGLPITEHCDKSRLATRKRLALFLDVCHAVQHAHQKGIIHRDLKPSNILVEVHDVRPVVKIIDFGISKAIGQQLTDKTMYTGIAHMIGTPMYMSPEQAGLSSLDVDTRSDVYSLGVLLYELLTGTTPFESETLKKVGYDEMRRIIREEEPPKPSARLSTLQNAALSTIAERRGMEPARFTLEVRGELDWIVMRALEKDRNRRYESASALAADMERYLADQPVEAGPPSRVYRLQKFVRRNRKALITGAVVLLTLVGATSVSVWQALQARDAQHQAEIDRDRANIAERKAATEAAIARAVNDFLQQDLLQQVNRIPQVGEKFDGTPNLTVKEALDWAAAKIDARFKDQPVVEAAIRIAIGDAYLSLLTFQFARPHFERALALRQTLFGPDHPDTISSMEKLANTYSWVGQHAAAIALRQRILENRRKSLGPDDPKTLACVASLAGAYQISGQSETSIQLLEHLLQTKRSIYGPTHRATLDAMHFLAVSYLGADRPCEAIALEEQVLEGFESQTVPAAQKPWPMRTLAQACQRTGNLDRADQVLREALEIERNLESSHGQQNGLANTLGWLARNLFLQMRYKEAESVIRESVAINQNEVPRRIYWASLLGAILLGQQKYAEAEPILLKAYKDMKEEQEAILRGGERRFLREVGEWIVRLYEETNQLDTARSWRERLNQNKEPQKRSNS